MVATFIVIPTAGYAAFLSAINETWIDDGKKICAQTRAKVLALQYGIKIVFGSKKL